MKSLITATFGVSFPQKWQGGALEWVKASSSCKRWQAEGGLKLSGKSLEWWAGKQRKLEFSVVIWNMISGWSSPLNWCLGTSFQLCLDEDALFAYGENNPWRIVWKSGTGGRACFPSFAEWDLGRAASFTGTAINFLLGSFLLKNTVYKQLSTPKRKEMYSLLIE